MNIEAITQAIDEARRFIFAANAARKRLEADKMVHISGSKETAACKRSSMALTRALARLRRP